RPVRPPTCPRPSWTTPRSRACCTRSAPPAHPRPRASTRAGVGRTRPPHRAARATFHGWRIAWALAVTQTVGFGVLFYAFQVFTLPMEAELGLSRAQTSGAYSLALLLSGLAAVPVGRWVDRRGARLLMTVASLAGAGLLLAW